MLSVLACFKPLVILAFFCVQCSEIKPKRQRRVDKLSIGHGRTQDFPLTLVGGVRGNGIIIMKAISRYQRVWADSVKVF